MTVQSAPRSQGERQRLEQELRRFILAQLERFRREEALPGAAAFDADTLLVGGQAVLKSRLLVELLLCLEEHMEDVHGKGFDWTDDRAFSSRSSPFRSVASLAAFAAEQV